MRFFINIKPFFKTKKNFANDLVASRINTGNLFHTLFKHEPAKNAFFVSYGFHLTLNKLNKSSLFNGYILSRII